MQPQDPDIVGLLAAGQEIEAIKRYRERYRVGLKEAKDAVDAMERGSPTGAAPRRRGSMAPGAAFPPAVDDALRAGQKIEAVKLYRQEYGVGLKEAKDAVDARQAELGLTAEKKDCFIATAACGTPDAPEVQALRRYRDQVLNRSRLGRRFVRAYYAVSPPAGAWIARHPLARRMARALIRPLAHRCERGGNA